MEKEILEMIDKETRVWDNQDVELFLSIFHPHMLWPWPVNNKDHNPDKWELVLGKFECI